MDEKSRGSSKLARMSPETLHKSIGVAREAFKIERWWLKGQPAVDGITAVLDVHKVDAAGTILAELLKLHDSVHQVGVVVFPYGIPNIDGVRFELNIDQAAR